MRRRELLIDRCRLRPHALQHHRPCDCGLHEGIEARSDMVLCSPCSQVLAAGVPGTALAQAASASTTLASIAKPCAPTSPSAMQRASTVSKTWRKASLSRKRPWRFLEKVEYSGTASSSPNRQNHRYAKFKCTSSQSLRSPRISASVRSPSRHTEAMSCAKCKRSRYQTSSPWQRASACGCELDDQLLSPRCFPLTDTYV